MNTQINETRIDETTPRSFAKASSELRSAELFQIDPTHASAQFKVRHLMVAHVRGELGPVSGQASIDPADLTVADLPRRDLDPAELEAVAAAVAQQPETWRHLVGFDSEERVYASLHRDAHVDIWLLCWTPENDTGWHDHDTSSGAENLLRTNIAA